MSELNVLSIGMSASPTDGGLERYFFGLLAALPQAGTASRGLVVGREDGSCDGAPLVRAFARRDQPMLRRWWSMREVAPELVSASDVVAAHFAPNVFPILSALRERPFVVHFHGPWALEGEAEGGSGWKTIVRAAIERRVYAAAYRFIVLSEAFGDVLCGRYGVPREKIRIVRGGVDLERFRIRSSRAEARTRLGWESGRHIVTTTRRLVPSKGIENLIEAIARVRHIAPNVLLNIIGSGPLRGELEQRIASRGLGEHVRLLGRVSDDDLPLAYRASDLVVVPSVAFEGFGLVVVEALACGTPVLATNVGGLPEVLGGLDPRLILPGSDVDAVERGLEAALRRPLDLPTEAACVAHARTFDWTAVARDVHAVYREAAALGRDR
jgi:glycosyltransferase involved in cell wall biosynthesis